MESRFIIFVVFATVAAQSSLVSSTGSSILPASAQSGFDGITDNQKAAVVSKFAAFEPIFDVLDGYAAELIYGLTATSHNESAIITEAHARAYDAVDYSVNPVIIAAGGPCDAAEIARRACYRYLDHSYRVMAQATALARSSYYSENKMEQLRIQVRDDLVGLIESLGNSVNVCLNITSTDGLAVSATALDNSRQGVIYVANSVFNAFKVYAAAYAAGSADLSLISKIESYRSTTLNGLKIHVENTFALLRAAYINSFQNEPGLIDGLFQIQRTEIVLTFKYPEGFEAMFSTINDSLSSVVLRLSDVGTDVFDPKDAAHALTNAKWRASVNQITALVPSNNPNDFSIIKNIQDELLQIVLEVANILHTQIDIAKTPTNKVYNTIAQIETTDREVIYQGTKYIYTVFKLLGVNNNNWSDKIKNELIKLQNDVLAQVRITLHGITKASTILANATSGTLGTCADDLFTSIGNIQQEVSTGTWNIADIISVAAMIVPKR